jgi:hypothetical protein
MSRQINLNLRDKFPKPDTSYFQNCQGQVNPNVDPNGENDAHDSEQYNTNGGYAGMSMTPPNAYQLYNPINNFPSMSYPPMSFTPMAYPWGHRTMPNLGHSQMNQGYSAFHYQHYQGLQFNRASAQPNHFQCQQNAMAQNNSQKRKST